MWAAKLECQGCQSLPLPGIESARILILESRVVARSKCSDFLHLANVQAEVVFTIDDTRKLLANGGFNILIINGERANAELLDFCHQIKSNLAIPILVLTDRTSYFSEEMFLDAGADDYLVLPLSRRILISRIAQQLSRIQVTHTKKSSTLKFANFILDLDTHTFFLGGEVVALSASEFRLLRAFMKNPDRIFSRGFLLELLGVAEGPGTDHIINSHISRLRLKIEKAGGPKLFSVVRGVGFIFASTTLSKELALSASGSN